MSAEGEVAEIGTVETTGDITVEFEEDVLEGEPVEDPYARAMAGGDTPPSNELVSWTRNRVEELMECDGYDSAVIYAGEGVCRIELYTGETAGEPDFTTYSGCGEL